MITVEQAKNHKKILASVDAIEHVFDSRIKGAIANEHVTADMLVYDERIAEELALRYSTAGWKVSVEDETGDRVTSTTTLRVIVAVRESLE